MPSSVKPLNRFAGILKPPSGKWPRLVAGALVQFCEKTLFVVFAVIIMMIVVVFIMVMGLHAAIGCASAFAFAGVLAMATIVT